MTRSDRFARPPTNLAIFRIVLFSLLFLALYSVSPEYMSGIPEGLRMPPKGYEALMRYIPFSYVWIATFRYIGLASCICAAIGYRTRITTIAATLCSMYILALPNFFGMVFHTHQCLIWFGIILSVSNSGDALSVDAWKQDIQKTRSIEYSIPLFTIWVLLGVIYASAAWSKLHLSGVDWAISDNLRYIFLHRYFLTGHFPIVRIDSDPLLYKAAGVFVLVFQLSFIFLILQKHLRILAVLLGLAFHVFSVIYTGIAFWYLLATYTALIDWHGLFLSSKKHTVLPIRETRVFSMPLLTGLVLVVMNAYYGIVGISSWPFTGFPMFAKLRSSTSYITEIVKDDHPMGTPIVLDTSMMLWANRIAKTQNTSDAADLKKWLVLTKKIQENQKAFLYKTKIDFTEIPDSNRKKNRTLVLEI